MHKAVDRAEAKRANSACAYVCLISSISRVTQYLYISGYRLRQFYYVQQGGIAISGAINLIIQWLDTTVEG